MAPTRIHVPGAPSVSKLHSAVRGGGLPPWVVNPANIADITFDFTGNQAWKKNIGPSSAVSLLTVSRASTGYVNDNAGYWTSVASNLPRISNLGLLVEESRTNSIRNNSMQGAMVMADNVELTTNGNFASAGTGWTQAAGSGSITINTGSALMTGDGSTDNTYIAQQISGLIVGRSYIITITGGNPGTFDIAVGSSAGDGSVRAFFTLTPTGSANSANPDRGGFVATATSHWITIARKGASQGTLNSVSVQDGERVQNGGFTSDPKNASQVTTQNGWQWSNNTGLGTVTWNGSSSVTLAGDNTHSAAFGTLIPTVAGVTYTISATVTGSGSGATMAGSGFQSSSIMSGTLSSANSKWQFTATGATTWVSFAVNGSTSVTIANVSVKSAGKLPTNWLIRNNVGLMFAVAGQSTLQGIDCIDVQFFGTATGAGVVGTDFETGTGIAGLTAQTWSASTFYALVGGSLSNLSSLNLVFDENTSVGGFVTNHAQPITPTASLAQGTLIALTTGGGTVACVKPYVQFNVTGAGAVNATLRIGWPQLELGAYVTSPIRTTAAAATRAADVVTMTTPPAFGSAYTLYAKGVPQAPVTFGTNQSLFTISDGTLTNRLTLARGLTTGNAVVLDSVGGANTSTSWAASASGKLAQAWASGDQATVFNAGAPQTAITAGSITGLNAVGFGANPTGSAVWNGFIAEAAIWASLRVPNAQLQSMTT